MKNLGIGLELLVLGMGTVVLSLYILYLFLKLSGKLFGGIELENLALLNKKSFGLKNDKSEMKKNHKADQIKESKITEKIKTNSSDKKKDKIEKAQKAQKSPKTEKSTEEDAAENITEKISRDNNDRDKINHKKDLIESINEANEVNENTNLDSEDINADNKAKIKADERVEKEDRVNMEGASMEAETKAIDRKKVAAITAVLKEQYFSESKKHFRIISIKRRNNQWKR